MKNLLIVATSALCVLLAVAVPLPDQDVQIVQIPLEGNKVCDTFLLDVVGIFSFLSSFFLTSLTFVCGFCAIVEPIFSVNDWSFWCAWVYVIHSLRLLFAHSRNRESCWPKNFLFWSYNVVDMDITAKKRSIVLQPRHVYNEKQNIVLFHVIYYTAEIYVLALWAYFHRFRSKTNSNNYMI